MSIREEYYKKLVYSIYPDSHIANLWDHQYTLYDEKICHLVFYAPNFEIWKDAWEYIQYMVERRLSQ